MIVQYPSPMQIVPAGYSAELLYPLFLFLEAN
jgi:hypothetical protein